MKIILSLVLLSMTLLVSGCGYDSMEECQLEESKECHTQGCVGLAMKMCEKNWKDKSDS